ncbi:MAG: ribonuclease E inhibitor RraB [Steroidobacteraceae bacterium]
MDTKYIVVGLIAVGAFSLLRVVSQWRGMSRKRRPIDWDEHFIQTLRKAGVNTFEEHIVDFFFTLPTRAAAEEMAAELRPEGYQIDIRVAEAGELSLHAQRSVRLVVADMQVLTARFNGLALRLGGTYDNWAVAAR